LEILRPNPAAGRLRHAVFDFDGTLSLVRTGWQGVMADLMVVVLGATPATLAAGHTEAAIRAQTIEPIFGLAGRPTIAQMEWLADEVRRRGGAPLSAEAYKADYLVRLKDGMHRLTDLQAGRVAAEQLRVPGALEFVAEVAARQIPCSIASGTDEDSVREEAAALGFGGLITEIRGARDDGLDPKRVLIERLTAEQRLLPGELAVFGDGRTEMMVARSAEALAVGVASDEVERRGLHEQKRTLLIAAGADVLVPDFSQPAALLDYIFPAG
jgi:phosphoglycolate phosphatase